VLTELLSEATGGSIVIFSTHRTEALSFATRCVALYDGEISYDGEPDVSVIESLG